MVRSRPLALIALPLILAIASLLAAEEGESPERLERAVVVAFDDRDYDRALRLINRYLEERPENPGMLYNLACAYSRLGDLEESTETLFRAVDAGFRDFAHMQRDPDLDAIRGEAMYTAIVEASRKVSTRRAEAALDRWRNRYGEKDYRYEVDEDRRLAFATAIDDTAHAEMRTMLQRQTDQLVATLFEVPPDEYVLIAIPTPRDAEMIFNGDDSIGGRYEHHQRRLISRDIGGSLRHEFVHALHYAHMERLGLTEPHALWVQEGIAALYERYEFDRQGNLEFLPNDRTNIVRNRARIGRLTSWADFCALSPSRFMRDAGRNYPQAREMFRFLAEESKLAPWYHAYIETFEEDPTGLRAFERVFDQPAEDVEKRWRQWARSLPSFDDRIEAGDAALGIVGGLNTANDGVLVEEVLQGSAASRARVRSGDLIVSVDGQDTRSFRELTAIIGSKRVGERVSLRVRRASRYMTIPVVLRALR